MQTQISCPRCQSPMVADVHQVIDVGQQPELKQRLLSGQLNVAVCPACGAAGQLSTPIVYHDPQHELFMLYVPQEMHMNQVEREQWIGRLTRQVVDNLPPEQRKGYLFRPQEIINMETFMEKVLETEGITKEMIDRQKKQSQLLQTLIRADKDVQEHLIKERASEIDETFFAMLQQYLDQVARMEDNEQLVRLTNLRARLMTETAAGRRLEKQQIAMKKLSVAAQKQGGLTPQLLLDHLLSYQDDEEVMNSLVISLATQGALPYEFFQLLTEAIEQKQQAGEKGAVDRLARVRDQALSLQNEMRQQSQQMVEAANQVLQAILSAPDKATAVQQHHEAIDDVFMYVLSTRMAQAEQQGDQAQMKALSEVHETIVRQMESNLPPEVMLLNELLEAETDEARRQLLAENADLVSPDLIQIIDLVGQQLAQSNQPELNGRLQQIKSMVEMRLSA
jgi:hypothetical protein